MSPVTCSVVIVPFPAPPREGSESSASFSTRQRHHIRAQRTANSRLEILYHLLPAQVRNKCDLLSRWPFDIVYREQRQKGRERP